MRNSEPKLYSYCLRYDDGAAPNPFFGVCTLAICKPAIRRTASVGDWVVGHGRRGVNADLSASIIYAMRIDQKLKMKEYDEWCRAHNQGKIPDWSGNDFKRRVGDCIYDYSRGGKPRLRESVHSTANRKRDLSGRYVLLSRHFFYFGDRAVQLDDALHPILHPQQGHKVKLNQGYVCAFVSWLNGQGVSPSTVLGDPVDRSLVDGIHAVCGVCSSIHEDDDKYTHDSVC